VQKIAQERKKRWKARCRNSFGNPFQPIFENKLSMLESANKDNEEKLKAARLKELEFLKKEQELKKPGGGYGDRGAEAAAEWP